MANHKISGRAIFLALLRDKRANIMPFAKDRAIILGLSGEEARSLDAHGSRMVRPGTLVFHKWSPTLGTKIESEWYREAWVPIRGLPFHLWSKDVLSSIAEKCGGLTKIDEKTISLKDLRWARFLAAKTDIRLIPKAMGISDGEIS